MNSTAQQLKKGFASLNKMQEENFQHLKSNVDENASYVHGLEDRISNLEKSGNRLQAVGTSGGFAKALERELQSNSSKLQALAGGTGRALDLQVNAASDMTEGDNLTDVIRPDRMPGVKFDPDRPSHVRLFLPKTNATSNSIQYVEESGYTDGTGMVAEGDEKPQSDVSLEAKNAPIEVIATWFRVSKQMLDDVSYLKAYISSRAPQKIFLKEDNQLLYGNGTAPNLQGITGKAQSYSEVLDNVDNIYDVIVNAINQLRTSGNGEYVADTVLINPTDFDNMRIKKGSDNHYLFSEGVRNGNAQMRIGGVPVTPITAVSSGDFLVGNFRMGATLAMRENVNIRFFEQDADNVQKNMITIRIEERIGLPISNPNAFVYGDFDSALST